LPKLPKVLVVKAISDWDIDLVPAVVAGLVPANQQYGATTWIERIQQSVRTALVLNSQFAHVLVLRTPDTRAVRKSEVRTSFFQEADRGAYRLLFLT
jgi:hypothetical protein